MTQETTISTTEVSFKDFLFKNKSNRIILKISAAAIIIQFAIFKYFYPYPSFIFDDSVAYLRAAFYNFDINDYLIGYSMFLRFFSVFTRSDTALVGFTYLFIQSSSLFLLFTLFYFYKIKHTSKLILLCLTVLSPLYFYLANLISSDGFFLALSFLWLALLIWIIHKPLNYAITAHTIIIFIAFTVRYNALIYPFISALAFGLCRLGLQRKIIGISASLMICGLFVLYTSYKHKQLTSHWQYSPFSGWQLANNAMYAYRYVNGLDRKIVPKNFQALDNMIRNYFDSSRDVKKHPKEAVMASTIYMWDPGLPLWKYQNIVFSKDTSSNRFKKWASMGPLYKQYGFWLITNYPVYFIKYFIWYNAQKYYAPPLEFLEKYNMGRNRPAQFAQAWFEYKNSNIYTRLKTKEIRILGFYPFLSAFVNVCMLCGLISFIILKGYKYKSNFRLGILLGGMVWFLNACFTIFASSVALRFQSFPLMLTTIFTVLLIEWLCSTAFVQEKSIQSLIIPEEQYTHMA